MDLPKLGSSSTLFIREVTTYQEDYYFLAGFWGYVFRGEWFGVTKTQYVSKVV